MNFCSDCGGRLEERVPDGDDRTRHVCAACGTVHYRNPLVVVGCIVESEARVLLCRRAIEPAKGLWTLPAGFLELGETLVAGACRETFEEAQARVEVTEPHAILDLPHIGQVHALFRARMLGPDYGPGEESLECAWFGAQDIPWPELAFPVIHFGLQLYLEDRAAGRRQVHHGRLAWSGRGSRFDAANYELAEHLRTPLA